MEREKDQDLVDQIINGIQSEPGDEVKPEFLGDFLLEAKERIKNIETNVLTLETDPENMEIIHGLFREFQIIKGLAGFVNQNLIREIAHQTEILLDDRRKSVHKVDKSITDIILASSDYLKKICDNLDLTKDPNFLKFIGIYLKSLANHGQNPEQSRIEQKLEDSQEPVQFKRNDEPQVNQGMEPKSFNELDIQETECPDLKLAQGTVQEKKAESREIIESPRLQEKSQRLARSGGSDIGCENHVQERGDSLMEIQGGKFLTFTLEKEVYGIPIKKVKEIIGMLDITHIPKTQRYVKGVINLRGKIIPIIDLRLKLGMEDKHYTERTCIIVIEMFFSGARKLMGVVVDAVAEVLNIQSGEIELPPEHDSRVEGDFLTGIGKVKDKVILILEIERILNVAEIVDIKVDRSKVQESAKNNTSKSPNSEKTKNNKK